jgi:hypothetical protein
MMEVSQGGDGVDRGALCEESRNREKEADVHAAPSILRSCENGVPAEIRVGDHWARWCTTLHSTHDWSHFGKRFLSTAPRASFWAADIAASAARESGAFGIMPVSKGGPLLALRSQHIMRLLLA